MALVVSIAGVTAAIALDDGGDAGDATVGDAAGAEGASFAGAPSPAMDDPGTGSAAVDLPTATVQAIGTDIPSGRYVRLGSFRSEGRALEEADRLAGEGIPATVVDTNRTTGLLPAFFVVVSGPTTADSEERRLVRLAERAGIDGALAAELAPAESTGAGALAGEYSGSVKQVDPKVDRLNREREVRIGLDAGGESGSVLYSRPACEASLSLDGTAGAAARYGEETVGGPCADGAWYLRTEGSELLATWWGLDGTTTFRVGRFQR